MHPLFSGLSDFPFLVFPSSVCPSVSVFVSHVSLKYTPSQSALYPALTQAPPSPDSSPPPPPPCPDFAALKSAGPSSGAEASACLCWEDQREGNWLSGGPRESCCQRNFVGVEGETAFLKHFSSHLFLPTRLQSPNPEQPCAATPR